MFSEDEIENFKARPAHEEKIKCLEKRLAEACELLFEASYRLNYSGHTDVINEIAIFLKDEKPSDSN